MNILYIYKSSIENKIKLVKEKKLPSNQLYGFYELKTLVSNITAFDSSPIGLMKPIINFINNKLKLNIKSFNTYKTIFNYDVILVKDNFSTSITLLCLLLNKTVIYIDPVLRPPNNIIRLFIHRINFKLASGSTIFSNTQYTTILDTHKLKSNKLKLIPFCLDTQFFSPSVSNTKETEPFILSVGMDLGRDYETLIKSASEININLKIVTLPYLLDSIDTKSSKIEILSNISYDELFTLYAQATLVVIPLHNWAAQYSSGTTSLLEAKLLKKPIISSKSMPLIEYLNKEDGVLYVTPENKEELTKAIKMLLNDSELLDSYSTAGYEKTKNEYNMTVFGNCLYKYIKDLHSK